MQPLVDYVETLRIVVIVLGVYSGLATVSCAILLGLLLKK